MAAFVNSTYFYIPNKFLSVFNLITKTPKALQRTLKFLKKKSNHKISSIQQTFQIQKSNQQKEIKSTAYLPPEPLHKVRVRFPAGRLRPFLVPRWCVARHTSLTSAASSCKLPIPSLRRPFPEVRLQWASPGVSLARLKYIDSGYFKRFSIVGQNILYNKQKRKTNLFLCIFF